MSDVDSDQRKIYVTSSAYNWTVYEDPGGFNRDRRNVVQTAYIYDGGLSKHTIDIVKVFVVEFHVDWYSVHVICDGSNIYVNDLICRRKYKHKEFVTESIDIKVPIDGSKVDIVGFKPLNYRAGGTFDLKYMVAAGLVLEQTITARSVNHILSKITPVDATDMDEIVKSILRKIGTTITSLTTMSVDLVSTYRSFGKLMLIRTVDIDDNLYDDMEKLDHYSSVDPLSLQQFDCDISVGRRKSVMSETKVQSYQWLFDKKMTSGSTKAAAYIRDAASLIEAMTMSLDHTEPRSSKGVDTKVSTIILQSVILSSISDQISSIRASMIKVDISRSGPVEGLSISAGNKSIFRVGKYVVSRNLFIMVLYATMQSERILAKLNRYINSRLVLDRL